MESVKRYFWVSDGMAEGGKARDSYVSVADFDRVTAEREALQLLMNERDDQNHSLEQRRQAEQQACQAAERNAARYLWLRDRNLETIHQGGVFAGITPENMVLNGVDLDAAVDAAIEAALNPIKQ